MQSFEPDVLTVIQRAGKALGLRAQEARVIARTSNLFVHVMPDDLVAKVAVKRTGEQAWRTMDNEVRLTRFLTEHGCSVSSPSQVVPPGPYQLDGLVVSLWERVPQAAPASLWVAASELRRCHDALVGYPGDHGALDVFGELGALLERTPAAHFHAGEHELLSDALGVLAGLVASDPDRPQYIHGDAHVGNTCRSGAGCVWLDWEDAVVGPPVWDVATLVAGPLVEGAPEACLNEVFAGYGTKFAHEQVETFVTLRTLQHEIWSSSVASSSHERRMSRQGWIRSFLRKLGSKGRGVTR